MKRQKKLLLLLLVLAVLVGATAIAGTISKDAAGQEDETQTVFSLTPENVTNLGWDYSDPETAVFGAGFHVVEYLFVRLAPSVFIGAAVGFFLTRGKR